MTLSSLAQQQLDAIELAYELDADATPTSEQRAVLAGFTGWGILAKAFAPAPVGEWLDVADRLEQLLPPKAFRAAADQADTSFFTPHPVAEAVWDILTSVGFDGGRVLEPGCGTGAFMGLAPAGVDITWTGVEIDPTSARIARLLHPGAEIIEGALQRTALRDTWFDAAIGNVPFSDVRVSDKEGRSAALHNYFVSRAIAAVRPGGYMVFVTSRHAMDSQDGLRTLVRGAGAAEVVGAVRLPSGAFRESGTDVVTDIVALRRRATGEGPRGATWPEDFEKTHVSEWGYRREVTGDHRYVVREHTGDTAPRDHDLARVSRYWEAYPSHVAGRMLSTGFNRAPLTVRGDRDDIDRAVACLKDTLPQIGERPQLANLDDVELVDAEGRKEGSYHLIDGQMQRVVGGALVPVRTSRELTALVGLRDLAVRLLELESDPHLPDSEIAPLRDETRAAYEAYVTSFGHLNRGTLTEGAIDPETGLPKMGWRRPAMGGFRKDPDSALVFALEVFDQDTGTAGPAPILTQRVNTAPKRAQSADTPDDALAISLGETGRVDLDRIAGLLGLDSADDARRALGDRVFTVEGLMQPASEALSGNVRRKLASARAAAAAGDADAERLAQALANVVPADLGATDIHVTLGSPLVTPEDIESFLKTELGVHWAKVRHTPATATWEIDAGRSSTVASAQMQWGTVDIDPARLAEHALNNRMPEIRRTEWRGDREVQVRDPQASAAAQAKLELIQDRFSTWVWEDAERAERIARAYNQQLNAHVPRQYDGAGLTFPGLSATTTPWPHQRAAVERIVTSERALIAHPVGFGKTLTMCLSARTLRTFGLARKPMIVVPNHLLDQIAREAQQAFPSGRFLIATKEDLARDARRLFAARCATGDWDAVIITHSAFSSIPVRPDVEREWVEEEKLRLRVALNSTVDRSKGAKAISRAVRALDARLSRLRDGIADDEGTVYFDQLGVDYIMVDECHLYRRLDTGSTARDSGMPSGSSKRATDLLVKIDLLAQAHPGKPVTAFFTGTPWSNTLAETWVWQRFLQPDTLDQIGLRHFDAWVSAFVRYETNIEVAPDGSGFRMHRRPVGITNAPELKALLAQVADILDPDSLGVTRPDLVTENVTVQPSDAQRAYVSELTERADAIRSGTAGDDNMLLVVGDGRKVALDPALVGIAEPSGKLQEAARQIAQAYHDGAERAFGDHPTPGVFQLVFMDLGTPRGAGDNQSYGRLRRMLADRGVPVEKVRAIHDATTDKARAALFASCRDGEVAVLIASTAKAGMGTNVQTRLTHLWHIDAPWLPSEVTQRDGRAIRPGNLSGQVTITRFVTEGTFDAYMWQALERKARSFDALYATGHTAREIEDVSQATISYGELKALASGNPLLLEQAETKAKVKQLQVLRAVHLQGVNAQLVKARDARSEAAGAERRAEVVTTTAGVVVEGDQNDQNRVADAVRRSWTGGARYTTSRVPYRGVELRLNGIASDRQPRMVQLYATFSQFYDLEVPGKVLRRGADTTAGYITQQVDRILDRLSEHHLELVEHARRLRQEADDAERAAEQSAFDQQEQLEAAIERLALIEAAIADSAEQEKAAA